MAESEVIQQASRIVGLVMGGSSIEDAMEEVIGPGDWSEQATELADLIEQAAADQFGRVEDAFYRKDRFEGDNCGIGSEGFQPGNKCGAKRGKGGAKPKGSTPRKPRKKAEPAPEAPAAPEASESKPKRGRKPKATPAATAAPKPRAPRAKKPKPKPSALQRGREVMHRLGKALRKMGAQTLKGLAKRVRAMRKAGGGLAKAAGRAAGAVAKGAGEAIRRAAPAGRRLAKAHHETGAAVRSATEAASTALDPIRSSALPISQESVEKISSNLSEISSSISEQPEKDPKKAQQSANRSMALIREIKSNAEMKKLQALLKKSKDPGAMQWRSKVDAFMGSIKALETAAKARKAAADAWVNQSRKKGKMSKRIEDKFYFGRRKVYFEGDNCGIGSEGFKPGNKCGARRGKGGSKSKPKGKGKAKPAPKPSPEGPWPKRATPSAGERRRAAGEPSKRLGDAVVSGLSKFSDPASVIATLSKESGHAGVDPVTRAAAEAIKKISELREQLSYHAFRVARGKTESREELRSYAKQAMEALATIAASRASLQKGMGKLLREDKRLDEQLEELYDEGGVDAKGFYRRREQIRRKAYHNLQARRQTRRALRALGSVPDFSEELKQLMRI